MVHNPRNTLPGYFIVLLSLSLMLWACTGSRDNADADMLGDTPGGDVDSDVPPSDMDNPDGNTDGNSDGNPDSDPMGEGTCSMPIPLSLSTPVTGDTSTGVSSQQWSQDCVNKYSGYRPTGPEVVYALDLDAPIWVDATVTPVDEGYYGIYFRTDCASLDGELQDACDGNAAVNEPYTLTTLLPAGTNYVFIDDFEEADFPPGQFQLEISEGVAPSCEDVVPELIDITSGSATLESTTVGANSSAILLESAVQCPIGRATYGNEKIYAIALDHRATIRATAEPLEPADSDIAVYIRAECDNRGSQLLCGESMDGGSAVAEGQLGPGAYFVIVDDYAPSVDDPQDFSLTIEVLD